MVLHGPILRFYWSGLGTCWGAANSRTAPKRGALWLENCRDVLSLTMGVRTQPGGGRRLASHILRNVSFLTEGFRLGAERQPPGPPGALRVHRDGWAARKRQRPSGGFRPRSLDQDGARQLSITFDAHAPAGPIIVSARSAFYHRLSVFRPFGLFTPSYESGAGNLQGI